MLSSLVALLVLAAGPTGPGQPAPKALRRSIPPAHLADYSCSESLELMPPRPERRPKRGPQPADHRGREAARGYLSSAIVALQGVPGPGQRNCVLDVIAMLHAVLADPPAVKRALDLATPTQRQRTIYQVAETFGALGNLEALRQIAAPLGEHGLPALAAAQARSGDVAGAGRTLTGVRDPARRALALGEAARAAAHAGHREGRTLLSQAAELAGALPEPLDRAQLLARVGRDQHQAGEGKLAERTLQAAARIAADLAAAGKELALSDVSQALAEAGQLDEAERLASLSRRPADRAELLGGMAAAVCVHDVHRCARIQEQAVQLLAPAPANDRRLPPETGETLARLLVPLAEAQIRMQQIAAARKTLERAQRLILHLTGELPGGELFPKIAAAQAQAGQLDAAVATARRSPTPADALAGVARALARSGKTRDAGRVLGLALKAVVPRSWHEPSDLLRIGQVQLSGVDRTALPATVERALQAVDRQSDDSERPAVRDIGALAVLAAETGLVEAWAAKQGSAYRRVQALTGLALGNLWRAGDLPPPPSWDLE